MLQARTSDPHTSHDAMRQYSAKKMDAAVDCAVAIHKQHGPLADFQYKPLFDEAWGVDVSPHLYRQARRTAADRGQIEDTGRTATNPQTGREQIIWAYLEGPEPEIKRCSTCGHVLRRETKRQRMLREAA